MCVIMVASKARPTVEMIQRAWDANKDGAGIAWREGKDVVWEKGIMEIERIKELCAKVPRPYVVHFRVASVGGVRPALTHPFLVGQEASLELKGRTRGAVLFHNGHWSVWSEKAMDAAIHSNNKIPEGQEWSDSRAMAWMTYIYGAGFMNLLTTQKGVLMSPEKFEIFTGGGWEKIQEVWCSNDYFWGGRRNQGSYSKTYGRICSVGKCHENAMVGRDICHKCQRERDEAAKSNVTEGVSSVGQSQQATVMGPTNPLARQFSMTEVEVFYKNGLISKSTLKKYRKANHSLHEKGNRGVRAQTNLRELSIEIAETLMTSAGSPN
jgi:hypothetical protein